MFKNLVQSLAVFALTVSAAHACGLPLTGVPDEFREASIIQLRDMGPEGLDIALCELDLIESDIKQASADEQQELAEDRKSCQEAVDRIAGQRHGHISRLYWFTDLEKAKQLAAESGKPILSLRMLGNLTDEFSCANSRFFRTALYANQEIGDLLRENFVLHWESVRPVPKVTIDFGDGRKVERTVTGNSAHYVLSAEGKPLDALPGLYSPREFATWLKRAEKLASDYATTENESEKITLLQKYHAERNEALEAEWTAAIEKVAPDLLHSRPEQPSTDLIYVDAVAAAYRAESKQRPELPILNAIHVGPQQTDRMVSDKLWKKLADHYRGEVKLDDRSVKLIRAERPDAFAAGALAFSKSIVEDPILRLVRNFEDSIALDTVRNKFLSEREIHRWFSDPVALQDTDQLNERVYAEIFLTPSSDPWLGLVPSDTYTALDNGGIIPSLVNLDEIGPLNRLD